ncbi:ATP-binding protein [Paenibacillus sp. BIHB 4019]|uniref:sensor histidine kinase n=1 Tax=Paenibacillus sp. BIHB 4019 TaxID=1870819 RepID=UPI0026A664AE
MSSEQMKRLMFATLGSFAITIIGLFVAYGLSANVLMNFRPFRETVRGLQNIVGTLPLVLFAALLLFSLCLIFFYSRETNAAKAGYRGSLAAFGTGSWLFRTIRWKLVFGFLISLVISFILFMLLYFAVVLLAEIAPLGELIRGIIETVGRLPLIIATCFFLFLVVFFLISNQTIHYLREITFGLQQIANGNLNYEIAVKSSDELGEVAYNINQMGHKLNMLIEEERKAEKTKNDLITGVSHDLRTPLTSILGFLELIEQDRYKDEVELRYYIGIAYEKSLSLKKLIDDLFEFTRVNNGMPLEKLELDLNGFIQQLLEEFVPNLEAAGMKGRVFPDAAPLKIKADGDRLVRAFENLVMNAIQYGQEGGYVDVRLRREQGYAVVEVVNYGEAIPEKYLPYLFERFYRGDQSRSQQTGGTGLGLSIAKSIVELHDGTIAVKSRRGETIFETRFPLY